MEGTPLAASIIGINQFDPSPLGGGSPVVIINFDDGNAKIGIESGRNSNNWDRGMAMGDKIVDEFLAALYVAAVEPERWAKVGKLLTERLGGQTSAIWTNSFPTIALLTHFGIQDSTAVSYEQYYHSVDPWREAWAPRSDLRAVFGWEMLPQREFMQSEFYTDFASKTGMCYMRLYQKVV